jgi:hypothetical protein
MDRRNFIRAGVRTATATVLAGLLPVVFKPYDGYQVFLDSIGHKIHGIVLREGKPMRHIVIEPELSSLDATNY